MNVKVFNITRNRIEKKKYWSNILLQVSIQITYKNVYNWNLSTFICENGKYLSIADDSNILSDEIAYVMGIVLTKMRKAIATNTASNVSIHFHSKSIRYKLIVKFCTQFY